ncbi:nuclear transport factor 2 family protein [Dyadobacter sp. CY323]|uniref:nuclear transport factor 2 family protein n=1 Tax=Dyadobacter sp. CY323 TaxID=2907302 RepID=UPI001F215220|nr:nuclear transport factor 2 family protein [Dyadobacter sp. CY323]MCE6992669.1 nuclear transport factor 2 family protein [Dyadobacter sp. CY323]
MKKVLLLILAAVSPLLLHAQSQPTESERAVQQTVVNMFGGLSEPDSLTLKKYCSADVTFYENGQVWNLDSMIRKAVVPNIGIDFKRTNKFDFIKTTIRENTAWVTYNLYSDIKKGERNTRVHWMETVIVVREKKQWKIKILHSTLIKRN